MGKKLNFEKIKEIFKIWYNQNKDQFQIKLKIRYCRNNVKIRFIGINSAISASLSESGINIQVMKNRFIYDYLICFDVMPAGSKSGYFCSMCDPDKVKYYPTIDSLYEDHIFTEFLDWVNNKLFSSVKIGFFMLKDNGSSWAQLYNDSQSKEIKSKIDRRVNRIIEDVKNDENSLK